MISISSLISCMLLFVSSSALVGFVNGISWNTAGNAYWANDCDFHVHDTSSMRVEASSCADACQASSQCNHFAWSSFEGGTCWFKYKEGITKEEAFYKPGVVCGVLRSDHSDSGTSSPEVTEATVVATQAEAKWAIVSTRVRLTDMDHDEPGGNYELWGNVQVRFEDYLMARTNVGSWNDHVICEKQEVGGPRDWLGDITQVSLAVAAGIATGGTSTAVVTAAVSYSVIAGVAERAQAGPSNCDNGHIAVVSYPVSLGVDTTKYNYRIDLREDDWGADDIWQADTRSNNPPNSLIGCWGATFNPSSSNVKQCNFIARTPFGEVTFESVIMAWVNGPVVDGEVQDFDSSGHKHVARQSFYGPSYGTMVIRG